MNFSHSLRLAWIGCLLLFAPHVFGAEIVVVCTASPVAALTAGVPNGLSAITCPQFNPAQGTLTSYVLFDDVTRNPGPITGSLTITNIGATISQKRGSILEN